LKAKNKAVPFAPLMLVGQCHRLRDEPGFFPNPEILGPTEAKEGLAISQGFLSVSLSILKRDTKCD